MLKIKKMHITPYFYYKMDQEKYVFISDGSRSIFKGVFFVPMIPDVLYNLAYGDLTRNGGIDDTTVSNNGDIIKIFATIIDIVQDFTNRNPSCEIHFSGSTAQRTGLFTRILKTYYQSFSKNFIITAYKDAKYLDDEELFDPSNSHLYLGFFIKKIN